MAPSPTGYFHVGSARTTLFNWLFARQAGGKFILRSEDTDRERSKKEYEEDITEAMRWLGLDYDEFYRQSERTAIYKTYLEKMIAEGTAFVSKEEPKEEGQRSEVIRFKNPNRKVKFEDTVRGEIEFDTSELGDFVIARSPEEPLYHLTVVVDDFEMGVTHVIRGDDGISNTPRQILLEEAIGAPRPVYAHLPLIVGPDKAKLSKRHATVSVSAYRDMGYLPDAFVNYLALLGWNPGDDREIFTRDELIKNFSLEQVQKGSAMFNADKLRWVNREHLKRLPEEEREAEVRRHVESLDVYKSNRERLAPRIDGIVNLLLERINVYSEIPELFEAGEFDYMLSEPEYGAEELIWKNSDAAETRTHLEHIAASLEGTDNGSFNKDVIKNTLWDYASEEGRGAVLWPMRFALTGKDKSPDPFTVAELLGKEESTRRIRSAINKLNA